MTSDDTQTILRRLDEIERKLDPHAGRATDPMAIGYSERRGNHPRKD
jgi:tetrahydromethanopterin S-methyltransferase subunit G